MTTLAGGAPSSGMNLNASSPAPPEGPPTSILGILVSYNTEPAGFLQLLDRFSSTVPLVVCDNSTDKEIRARLQEHTQARNMTYLPMNGNVGIGHAQNLGIEYAKTRNAAFVLLIDDDSHLSATDALQLREAYWQLRAAGEKVGAVSARAVSADGKNLSNVSDPGQLGFTPCPLLNSSGTLIPVEVLAEVGGLDERLFIDLVDFDWGWRALRKGFGLFIAEGVRFQHALGIGAIQALGLRAGIPNPIRHYYQTRNTLFLMTRPHVPLHWKVSQVFNLIIKIAFYPIFVAPRLVRLSHFSRGLFDAMTGAMGPKR